MLKPAQLYREKLQEEVVKAWYDPRNRFWFGGPGGNMLDLPDNNETRHCFASVGEKDDIIGYIAYELDWSTMSAYSWSMISFKKGSLIFVGDLLQAIKDCFHVYHMNRICWWCYADNPAIKGYRNFIKRYGGIECAHYRQDTRLLDGKLHDSVAFEILSNEFRG